ncbi:MAG: T9SS type A sorting domain-containing protein, partial [Rhodothermales bacterium]|nr:T9SS type A sorting domain-containing protein [Rhodothermales bacterium]
VVEDLNRTYIWGVLPVELTEFTAVQNDGDVLLRWSTATETNGTQFDIEVAGEDGDFQTAGFVEAVGQSTSTNHYSFTIQDLEPGIHKFRLRHVDTEGVSTLSDVVELDISMLDNYNLSEIYPNPFNPSAAFTLRVKDQQQLDVSVYDMLGRQVQSIYSGIAEANQKYTFELDGSRLSSGVYIVRVAADRFAETKKVTLLK